MLINNAGFGTFKKVEQLKMEEIESMFYVNVFGLIACTKEVLPYMIKKTRGQIINISSIAGKIATPKSGGYSATKHAVLGFSNSLRMELLKTNIKITTINPGPVKTSFFDIADTSGDYTKNIEKLMLDSAYVAKKITKTTGTKKRELNIPAWMGLGGIIYNISPKLFEQILGKKINKK